jgi:hypothetical protein
LNKEHSISVHGGSNSFWHAKRFCKQNNQLPTKTHVELKDNSNVTRILRSSKGKKHSHLIRGEIKSIVGIYTNGGGFGIVAQVAVVRAVGSSAFLSHSDDEFVVRCIGCSNDVWDMRM